MADLLGGCCGLDTRPRARGGHAHSAHALPGSLPDSHSLPRGDLSGNERLFVRWRKGHRNILSQNIFQIIPSFFFFFFKGLPLKRKKSEGFLMMCVFTELPVNEKSPPFLFLLAPASVRSAPLPFGRHPL